MRMSKYLIELMCRRQALQILLQVVLCHNAQTRNAITESGDLVIEVCAVALLNYVVRCIFGG
jgi:hypothetical protein